jgi:hypothetical protein
MRTRESRAGLEAEALPLILEADRAHRPEINDLFDNWHTCIGLAQKVGDAGLLKVINGDDWPSGLEQFLEQFKMF